MKDALLLLSPTELRTMASALRSGRLDVPCNPANLARFVANSMTATVASSLQAMADVGMNSASIAYSVELLAAARSDPSDIGDVVDLVMTGPQAIGTECRDTSVVVSDLFRTVETDVLVVGFAMYQGRRVFHELAERMSDLSALCARMYFNIERRPGNTSSSEEIVRQFVDRFRFQEWPAGIRYPELYYDPRALCTDRSKRAALHPKCIVTDCRRVLVTSANFTEAAQERNIEIGVLLKSALLAQRIARFFNVLTESKQFVRAL